jgi:hypothetical protein
MKPGYRYVMPQNRYYADSSVPAHTCAHRQSSRTAAMVSDMVGDGESPPVSEGCCWLGLSGPGRWGVSPFFINSFTFIYFFYFLLKPFQIVFI